MIQLQYREFYKFLDQALKAYLFLTDLIFHLVVYMYSDEEY